MLTKKFEPTSYFFVDHTKLKNADTTIANDAFGPVNGNTDSQYRTTSFVQANNTSEKVDVFAICDGQLLIQPMEGSTDKVNLILKPNKNSDYAPLKIKYFIYRGVTKNDFIIPGKDENSKDIDLINKNSKVSFIQRIWNNCNDNPEKIKASQIGYQSESQKETDLIDKWFYNVPKGECNILSCSAGEHIGYFTGRIGLDIVLDDGDYEVDYGYKSKEKQNDLFVLDLKYARKTEHIFDTSSIADETEKKSYKEHILKFIDAAAFWGAHIVYENGEIKNPTKNLKTKNPIQTNIYTDILEKYQTKNTIYLYTYSEKQGSVQYYNHEISIIDRDDRYERTGLDENLGNKWPISIYKHSNENSNLMGVVYNKIIPFDFHSNINFVGQYTLDEKEEWMFKLPKSSKNVCSTFAVIKAKLDTSSSLTNYYNNLWPANIKKVDNKENNVSMVSYNKSIIQNLYPALDFEAKMHHKIVFNKANGTERRLYIAMPQYNNQDTVESNTFNIKTNASFFDKTITSPNNFMTEVYGDKNFSLYTGKFECLNLNRDEKDSNSLSLIHKEYIKKRNSYFHLGITENEYSSLFDSWKSWAKEENEKQGASEKKINLDNINHIYFDLKLIPNKTNSAKIFKAYELGLKYDNTIFYPKNFTTIYTIDGFYFFSQNYTKTENFSVDLAKNTIKLETLTAADSESKYYKGEFLFDGLDSSYKDIITGGYKEKTAESNTDTYINNVDAYEALTREYFSIPSNPQNKSTLYYAPYLNLYKKDQITSFTSPTPPYSAVLKVTPYYSNVKFECTNENITFEQQIDETNRTHRIKITCNESLGHLGGQIMAWEYPEGETNKEKAKLAGMIILGENSPMKILNTLLINVKIKPKDTERTGSIKDAEKETLKDNLHQFFIHTRTLEKKKFKEDGNDKEEDEILDLSSDENFKLGYGFLKDKKHIDIDEKIGGKNLDVYLCNKFKEQIKNNKDKYKDSINLYNKCFLIFIFDFPAHDSSSKETDKEANGVNFGRQCSILFNNTEVGKNPRSNIDLTHEILHGLGLKHTFGTIDPSATQSERNAKYIFGTNKEDTNNIMSYNKEGRTLWNWQQKIVNAKVKETGITIRGVWSLLPNEE